MTKTEVIRIEKTSAMRNGIIIVQSINIKNLLRMVRDGQMMVICRRLSEITRETFEKMDCNQEYTFVSLECFNRSYKHELGNEHHEVYATIERTSLH